MVRQEDIERSAGIDSEELASFIMTSKAMCAVNTMHLLNMQVSCPDSAGMAMLRRFVADCKAAMVAEKARSTSDRYIEVDCPCGCDHTFEIDLKNWTY